MVDRPTPHIWATEALTRVNGYIALMRLQGLKPDEECETAFTGNQLLVLQGVLSKVLERG